MKLQKLKLRDEVVERVSGEGFVLRSGGQGEKLVEL